MEYKKEKRGKKRTFIIGAVLLSLFILLGVGVFTYRLYVSIVDESKLIAWEMTLKGAQVMDLRLDNIRNDVRTFTNELNIGEVTEDELNSLVENEMESGPVFRIHVIAENETFLTDSYGMTEEEKKQLLDLCQEDGVFSENYLGQSGRWQTAVAYSGKLDGRSVRVIQECVLDQLYLADFMEFYEDHGYSYIISGEDGEFIMLPQNKFGQGLYSGLFTMLEAYEQNTPKVIEKVRNAMAEDQSCTIQMRFRGEDSFFCFVPLEESSEWYVVSVIPAAALQKNGMTAIGVVVLLAVIILFAIGFLAVLNQNRIKFHYEMESAKRADRAKTSFLSNMSHEMRTPMNAILGMTEIMRLNIHNEKRIEDCIDKIHISSKYLLGIINDILDMSKIENGKMTLDHSPFLLKSVLETAVNLSMPEIKKRGHDFNVHTSMEGYECLVGDEKRISQVLVNMLANAVKYTPDNGKIDLSVFCKKDPDRDGCVRVQFVLEDNGIGMSKEYQKLIFEPFSQEKNSLSKGTGLGMAITAEIVRLMDGRIVVESELHKGSRFQVFLSLPQALPGEAREPKRQMEEVSDPLSDLRILLVEDNELNAEIAVELLEHFGAQVDWSMDGVDACARFEDSEKGCYDLILMDIQMPKMNGYDAAMKIRSMQREDAAGIPILAMTADAFSEDVSRAAESGMDGHVAKPVDIQKLLREIERVVSEEKNCGKEQKK